MTGTPRVWMRHELRRSERRAPIVPDDAGRLVARGVALTVERSPQRAFAISGYAAAGCTVADAGSWVHASPGTYILGLKELPDEPVALRHRHIFFGHAYKGQRGARELLGRFAVGGGALLDLEYLVDDGGRRLAAFGYWAGYAGAALAVLHSRGALTAPLRPLSKDELDTALRRSPKGTTRALVIGALGRCGRGSRDALAAAEITPTRWDMIETRCLDRPALLGHDILVNAVSTARPIPPFLSHADLDAPTRVLRVIADVTCDVTSPCNVLPIYDRAASWNRPVQRLCDDPRPLDIIALDNLPSLLPKEASAAFSAQLLPALLSLGCVAPAWQRCAQTFHEACKSTGLNKELADV